MPKSAFNAIRNSVCSFLGGAKVSFSEVEECDLPQAGTICDLAMQIEINDIPYQFCASRGSLAFTATEISFVQELLTAMEGLFSGFTAEGYAAHFRTALLTSLMDIAVARYIRGDRKGVFWTTQNLIQLLKKLSYQRYEGAPATTGFLIYRNQLEELLPSLQKSRYNWLDLGDDRRRISDNFFINPLSYRFVDGLRALYICDIRMNVKGIMRTNSLGPRDAIDQLSNRETVSLLQKSGAGAFAIFVNEASEVEVVLDSGKLLVWRKGDWGIYDPDIFRVFLHGALDKRSIDALIWSVYALSKSRHGTVILISNGKTDLQALSKGSVGGRDPLSRALIRHVCGTRIGELKRSGELMRILSSDGLTVINRKGELLDTGLIIDTSKAGDLVSGGGRTTAAAAASHYGRVIKVSEDGPVELLENGRRVYRFG
ncbi:MAG: hypothetical protein J7K75_04325 [Desulfuromonas sp.]|nr:hypothetical protein [Desulfuromonas sp.]